MASFHRFYMFLIAKRLSQQWATLGASDGTRGCELRWKSLHMCSWIIVCAHVSMHLNATVRPTPRHDHCKSESLWLLNPGLLEGQPNKQMLEWSAHKRISLHIENKNTHNHMNTFTESTRSILSHQEDLQDYFFRYWMPDLCTPSRAFGVFVPIPLLVQFNVAFISNLHLELERRSTDFP